MNMGIKLYNQLLKQIVEKHGPCDFVHVHSTADSSFKIILRKVTKSVGIFRTPVSVILYVNLLTPKVHYSGRTAPLTSKRCILYIYSTNTGTEYFKLGLYSLFFLFKM